MKEQIEKLIKESLKNLKINEVNFLEVNFFIEHPEDFKNGDYSSNVAMIIFRNIRTGYKSLSKDLSKDETTIYSKENFEKVFNSLEGDNDKSNIYNYKNPFDIAGLIKNELEKNLPKGIERVEVAGSGFINFYLSREFFTESIKEILDEDKNWGKNNSLKGQKIMVEYTDPNPFKPFHIGHLMTNAIGESVSRIVEFSGAKTIRANYQGDIGPHVAKAIWGIKNRPIDSKGRVEVLAFEIGQRYSLGSEAYDNNLESKKEIDEINKKIYDKSDKEINEIYNWGRKITLDTFEEIYKILGTKFDHYFFESEMVEKGQKIVKENIGKVFDESEGAVIFHGENYDKKLHTRVFINSQDLPTYETKEIGLTMTKFEKENPDLSIVITATEQAEYMKVVQKAISLIHPDYEKRMKHITHGMMKFASGKMSSRKGNVVTGESLLRDSMATVLEKMKDRDLTEEEKKKISEIVGVSALKYSILKSSLGSDIVYDFEKSISFEGDSGPYLQYTAVRANSILEKSKKFKNDGESIPDEITSLEKLLYQFPEVVEKSYELLEPHHIATYLTELASAFNTFYGNTKILESGNKFASYQLELVKAFYQTMKNGLWLLGIETPERM